MTTDKGRKHLPPYVSYRTFHNFIDRLQQQGTPQRIDRSYWSSILSGSTGPQLMAAMRFLGLVDANDKPTERLKLLVPADGEKRIQLIRGVATEAFSFVIKSNLDLSSATYAQLEECFHSNFNLTDDVRRKCVKFFIAMAGDAGIHVSPHITRHTRAAHGSSGTRNSARKTVPNTTQYPLMPQGKPVPQGKKVPQGMEHLPENHSLLTMLIEKFPNFDPSWNDELKLKWISTFDVLFNKVIFKA
ncbi:MAG: DUF5343 domain-containing protein [Dehalococcoidales bacterium]